MSALFAMCLLGAPGDDAFAAYLKKGVEAREEAFNSPRLIGLLKSRAPVHRFHIGRDPGSMKSPLKAMVTGTLKRDTVAIEKLHFQSVPGLYVTGNLYRPAEARGKLPAILYVCGHSGKGRDGNKTAFQDHGMWFARNGYVCLIIDTLQLGEVKGIHHGTYSEGKWHWHSRGYTPASVECLNGIRAIDYLISRKDVDEKKIAVTGISGGGATTFWIAAADPRVKAAVPVSGMTDFRCLIVDKVINRHCDCMFPPNEFGREITTFAAMIAPRPLLFANSDKDALFPMDGNRRISARLRRVYKALGKPDNFEDFVSEGGHDYRPDLRIAVFKFLNKHLKGEKGAVKDADDKPLPGKELRVFPTDDDLPEDSINHKIDESFLPVTKPLEVPEKADEAFRLLTGSKIETLRFQLQRSRPFPPGEEDVKTLKADGDKTRGLIWVTLEDTAKAEKSARAAAKDADAGTLVILAPRGSGSTAFTKKSPPNTIERSLFLLGETLDGGRIIDIQQERGRAGKAHPGVKAWVLAGEGRAGVLAAYAALTADAMSEVVAYRPTTTHLVGPHLPGILIHTDIPEAMGLLAPRKLTLIGAKDKAFDHTAKLYQLAGAKENFIRK